ncbi:MAG: hypothetical protein MZV70_67320 [Desulfobacterales bacterium]|nr:hypothetical protein [Desulfobacterales bacterium]
MLESLIPTQGPWPSSVRPSKELSIGNRVIKNLIDFGFTGQHLPHQPQRGRDPRDQGLQVDPGLPGRRRRGPHGHPGQVRAPGRGRLRQERGQAHHHQLGRLRRDRRRGRGHRKGLPGARQALRHPHPGPELPGDHQHRRRDPRLLQLHLHEAGAGLHLHRRPERRRRRGRPPGLRPDGGRHPHLRLQRQRRGRDHPRDHALPGRRRGHPGHRDLCRRPARPGQFHADRHRGRGPQAHPGDEGRPHQGRRQGGRLPHRRARQGGHRHRPDLQESRRALLPRRGPPDPGRRRLRHPADPQRQPGRHHHQHRRSGGHRHRRPGRPPAAPCPRFRKQPAPC